jgi:pyrimidine-nucleoside phosphorylase
MNPKEIIAKKRDRGKLTKEEIHFFINEYLIGNIPEYQMAAMLMAIVLNDMDEDETFWLTKEFITSGKRVEFTEAHSYFIDKHSTGGVGDKISLMLAPIAAECGVYVPMISGRALGHTGGTLDKLESIPGFNVEIPLKKFRDIVLKNRFAIIGQSDEVVPADRRIYALRDATATVESIPLITASIMGKKIAEGIDGLVVDLKVGEGAFIEKVENAKKLAASLLKVGKDFGKDVSIIFTDMNSPLGSCVGNSLEVIEAIEFLKGESTPDLKEVTYALIKEMLYMAGRITSLQEADRIITDAVSSGRALQRFKRFIELQDGDPSVIDDYSRFGSAKYTIPIKANNSGYIHEINAREIGWSLIGIGAGRNNTTDKIDPQAGLKLDKKIGEYVSKDSTLARLFYNKGDGAGAAERIKSAYIIKKEPIYIPSRIIGKYE